MASDEPMGKNAAMQIKYRHPVLHEGKPLSTANIIWAECNLGSLSYRVSRFAMRNGRFPPNHPCCPNSGSGSGSEMGDSDSIKAFRERGYWASCFPEGDGITLYWWSSPEEFPKKSKEAVISDIRDCFGWEVTE